MKSLLWMSAAILMLSGISLSARADDIQLPSRYLTITTPQLEPRVVFGKKARRLASQEAPILKSESRGVMGVTSMAEMDTKPFTFTWMRTNPDMKPYKFMNDLTFAGVPLFVAGIIAKGEKKSFRQNTKDNKHTLLTNFKTGIDDYTQFFGPAMTVGLKVAGVEGRSDWGRFLASTAMSYGLMAGFVNSIKYTAKEMRPDGSTANSWPSGHTATAFVGATILHKEYGLTRSPWYSVAGYGVATATGVMRVLNNRHWVSDVLSGAGIGIMSGELAYAFSDLIFKHRGLLRGDISSDKSIIDNPSFFSVSMGIGFGSKNLDFDMSKFELTDFNGDNVLNVRFGASTAVGVEGAYFFNKYIGLGGRLRVNSSPIKGWDGIESYAWNDLIEGLYGDDYDADADFRTFIDGDANGRPLLEDANFTIKSDHLTEFAADLGIYFNLPLSRRFAIGSKLLLGRSIMQEVDLNATATGGKRFLDITSMIDGVDDDRIFAKTRPIPGTYTTEWDYFTLGGNNTMKFGTGLSLTYAYKENYAWRLFLDYDFTRKTYTMTYNPAMFVIDAINMGLSADDSTPLRDLYTAEDLNDLIETQRVKKNRHTFILGGSLVISF